MSTLPYESLLRAPRESGLNDASEWRYNRWLGRWRRTGAPPLTEGSPDPTAFAAGGEAGTDSMPFDDSDLTLVDRVKAGDVRAFEMLHRRYYGRIYRYAYMRLSSAEDAADVACATFVNALKALPSYQFRRTTSLYPWL